MTCAAPAPLQRARHACVTEGGGAGGGAVAQAVVLCCAGNYAPAPSERSDTVHTWLQHYIAERLQPARPGSQPQPQPPLLAGVYATLATAMTSYEQCRCDFALRMLCVL